MTIKEVKQQVKVFDVVEDVRAWLRSNPEVSQAGVAYANFYIYTLTPKDQRSELSLKKFESNYAEILDGKISLGA